MIHFAGKAVKVLALAVLSTVLLTGFTLAAESNIAIAVGATTGSSLRMRSEASTSSSVVTTLNKGVAVAVLDDSIDGWYQVSYAGSTGYVSADYLIIDQDNVFETYGRVNESGINLRAETNTTCDILAVLNKNTSLTVTGFESGWYRVTTESGVEGYVRSDFVDLTSWGASASGSGIAELALAQLGTPYVWGGSRPGGFDCSGFTMYVYKQFGYSLPHTASGQWNSGIGQRVYSIGELQPGDLVLFNDPSRNAGKACSHVGIYIGNGQHIHASSSKSKGVIISDLTSGYYNRYFIGGIHV